MSEKYLTNTTHLDKISRRKLLKTAEFQYDHLIEINGKNRPFISRMTIKNAVVKTDITIMKYHDIKIKQVPASAFNLNLLVK